MRLSGSGSGVDGSLSGGPCFGREAMVGPDTVRSEGVEAPVLQEDLDRPAQGRRAGSHHGGRLQLVVRPGEEHDRDRFVHCRRLC